MLFALLLSGCEVPTPPPELPTATPGSSSPDGPPGVPAPRAGPDKGYTPVAAGPGKIFFVRSSGLWRINPDGSGETKLAAMTVTNPPQPSPDGSMVAFTTATGLYTVPSAGGTSRKLASDSMADYQRIGWTPDGSYVGYIAFDPSTMGQEEAWAVPVQGGGNPVLLTTLTDAAVAPGPVYERSVQWSPDGLLVVASGVNNPFKLLRWPLTPGGSSNALDVPGGEPDWSPDGRTIIYAETLSGALLIYGVSEAGATPFRNEPHYVGTGMGPYAAGPGPRFSPASTGSDSDLIAYRSRTQQGEPQVGIRLRSVGDLAPLPPYTNNPAWSPGGDRLVVETGSLRQAALGPKWTPGGLSIARLNFSGDEPDIMSPLVKDAMWPAWGK